MLPKQIFDVTEGGFSDSVRIMSRQMLLIGILLVTFGCGAGVGLYLGVENSTPASTVKRVAMAATDSSSSPQAQDLSANVLLSNRIRELEKELGEQSQNRTSILADRLALFKKYQQEIRLRSFSDGDLKVVPAMVDILGLSKDEQARIERNLKEIQNEMEQLKDEDTVVAKQTPNGITYDIAADPRGKDLKEKLKNELTTDIGDERAALFINYSNFDSYDSSFAGFAEKKGEVTINWTNQNGKQLYTYKESYGGGSTWTDTPSPSLPRNLQKYLPTETGP